MCCGAVARCASYDAHLVFYVKLYVHSLVDKLRRNVIEVVFYSNDFYVKLYVHLLVDKLRRDVIEVVFYSNDFYVHVCVNMRLNLLSISLV